MEEASLLMCVVDATTGITNLDDDFANMLRKKQKNVFLVVNKVDNTQRMHEANEFYSLGYTQYLLHCFYDRLRNR